MRKAAFPLVVATSFILVSFSRFVIVRPESYFTKDNKINFTITAENGTVSYSEVKIKDVTTEKDRTSIYAHDNRLNDQRKSTFAYRMNFYSDSLNWCVDAMNHLNCPVNYSSNSIPVIESDSLVYPYGMKVGDTLRHANASETYMSNTRVVSFRERKVAGIDKIGVQGEQVDAFRIECKMVSASIADYGALGKIPTEATYDFVEWFVPSKGVVKSERKSKTGKTITVLQ